MAKENLLELGEPDFSELKITGVLNYDIYSKMKKEDLREFVLSHAENMARKFVSMDWQDVVHIKSEYVVIDTHYQTRGMVTASLMYTHELGASGEVRRIEKEQQH